MNPDSGWTGDELRKVNKVGQVNVKGVRYQISNALARHYVHVLWDQARIIFVNTDGEILIEHPYPPNPASGHISNRGQRRAGEEQLSPLS